jgi:hypothetical protein
MYVRQYTPISEKLVNKFNKEKKLEVSKEFDFLKGLFKNRFSYFFIRFIFFLVEFKLNLKFLRLKFPFRPRLKMNFKPRYYKFLKINNYLKKFPLIILKNNIFYIKNLNKKIRNKLTDSKILFLFNCKILNLFFINYIFINFKFFNFFKIFFKIRSYFPYFNNGIINYYSYKLYIFNKEFYKSFYFLFIIKFFKRIYYKIDIFYKRFIFKKKGKSLLNTRKSNSIVKRYKFIN